MSPGTSTEHGHDGPSALVARGLGYARDGSPPVFAGVDLTLRPGQLHVVVGPSGVGKTTLARVLVGLWPRRDRGQRLGSLQVGGQDPAALAPRERPRHLGHVTQNPADQVVAATVGDEVAFALESLATAPADIDVAVAEALAAVGMTDKLEAAVEELSGGELQRVVLASALALRPGVVVLDEPLAHLDPEGAWQAVLALQAVAAAGTSIVVFEHRWRPFWAAADERGLPEPCGWTLGPSGLRPTARSELAQALPTAAPALPPTSASPALWSGRLEVRRPDGAPLFEAALDLHPGATVALLGPNGAGKSSLLRALAGVVRARGLRCVRVPQDPDLALVEATVDAELGAAGLDWRHRLGLAEVDGARAPQSLSRGQRLRLAVAAAVAARPEVLLLDEPTAGQDPAHVQATLALAREALPRAALVVATHDVAVAERWASGVWWVEPGGCRVGPVRDLLDSLPPRWRAWR